MKNRKAKILIPFYENKDGESILLALGAIKDYSNLSLEDISQLNNIFKNNNDIVVYFETQNLDSICNILSSFNFVYQVEEL